MKQLILPFNTGQPTIIEVPAPKLHPGEVLIRTTRSVVSTGTERMLMEFGQAGLLGKLRQQPEKARQILNKLKTDGLTPTIRAVRSKLDTPIPLGYSSAGVVLAAGTGIYDIKAGDRVASNGPHAEVVSVPRNLVARIPDSVSDDQAAFTVLGAIALQSIRLTQPTLGETIVVIGLGLIGQLTAQLLLANGCRVIGTDPDQSRILLAAQAGVQPLEVASGDAIRAMTHGYGADAVIVTATSSNDAILRLAADMCRKRGRIVLTGVVDMKLSREAFFKKELSFQVSSSYGPGRYERSYEQQGLDYPIGYVRWTEGRNFDAVLGAMQRGQLNPEPLISARIPFQEAHKAYEQLNSPGRLASVFTYPDQADAATVVVANAMTARKNSGDMVAIVGAGAFASAVLLPALKATSVTPHIIISKSGLSAATLAKKFGIGNAGTDFESLLQDSKIGAVVIATPHNSHAALSSAALRAGLHVFVEKPLALCRSEITDLKVALHASAASITVGFNRRYAPLAVTAKKLLDRLGGPRNIVITVNAGRLASGHWISDKETGGGRLAGESCHFIDLCAFFTGSLITGVFANALNSGSGQAPEDANILLRFADGSNAVVNYFCNGSSAYDKERVELYRAGCTIVIENWRSLRSYGFPKDLRQSNAQDKGHRALIAAWIKSLKDGQALMSREAVMNSSTATISVEESLMADTWISL